MQGGGPVRVRGIGRPSANLPGNTRWPARAASESCTSCPGGPGRVWPGPRCDRAAAALPSEPNPRRRSQVRGSLKGRCRPGSQAGRAVTAAARFLHENSRDVAAAAGPSDFWHSRRAGPPPAEPARPLEEVAVAQRGLRRGRRRRRSPARGRPGGPAGRGRPRSRSPAG